MNLRLRVLAVLVGVALSPAASAQDRGADGDLESSRIGQIAVRAAVPERVAAVSQRELDRTLDALVKKQSDPALAHWREFMRRRAAEGGRFDPGLYVDYLLNRLASARNVTVAAAGRKLNFYDRQEAAAMEHVSTVDKQLSVYGEADAREVPLREPELADYGDGVEPVSLPAGATVGVPELKESLRRWREKLPEISRAREAALGDFERALRADAPLIEEMLAVDKKLRAEIIN